MFHKALLAVCTVMLSAGLLSAQEAGNRGLAVAPWINEDTVWVASARIADVNLDAVEKWILKAADQTVEPAEADGAKRSISQGFTFARGLRDQLKAAGVKDVYAIYDAHPQRRDQVILVLPAGQNAQAVADKLAPMMDRNAVQVDQNAVVIQMDGGEAERQPTAARPDMATALARSDAPVIMALTLPQEIRNMMPPEMPERMGGADLTPIQDGFMWACFELRFTPEPALHGMAQMDSAANAKASVQSVQTTMDAAAQSGSPEAGMEAAVIKLLQPEAKEDQVVVDLPSAKLDQALTDLGPSLREARQRAKRVASASQIRQLLMGVRMFAQQNGQATPDRLEDLEEIFKAPGMIKMLSTNPQRPDVTPGYVYVKQELTAPDPSNRVMMYETYDTWKDGINVGYVDGHVEWVCEESLFLEKLNASGAGKK